MKLCVLLSALLALCSHSLQDVVEESAQVKEVTPLNPDLEDRIPEFTANGSLLALLAPAENVKNRTAQSFSVRFGGSTLKWLTSYGSLPSGAVYIYNNYAKRYDYICKYGCSAGFFNPKMGPRCRYPYAEKERLGYPFQILVNKDNFEALEWKGGSWGGVPANSVKTCYGEDVFVGKNKYGLGKVHVRHKAFFLPWEGREYWYKQYQVLTINKDFYKERVYNVRYNTNVKVTEHPPESLHQSTITNNECRPVVKTFTMSKMSQEEKRWDTSTATTTGISSSITAQIPAIGSLGITLSKETTKQFSSGTTVIESKTHSVSVQINVPANHYCSVSMVGRKYEASIPFTALLSRTYRNGRTRVVSITGKFSGMDVGGIHSVVDRCTRLPNARPCA
uniref:natterin-3-like n=1 Tax=Semicossyphus pulcher TaxID=241346 RepID=UPI0037E7502E